MIGAAFELAYTAHKGQKDKAGMAYIGHVARVAAGVDHPDEIIVALLHDVVEDCDIPISQIERDFGAGIAAAVQAITRHPNEASQVYYQRVKSNPLALAVKLADIADTANPARLAMLDGDTRARLTQKHSRARAALSPN